MAGSPNVIELNFDSNLIRSSQATPFSLFPNLEIISLKNNVITEFPIGKLKMFSIVANTKTKNVCILFQSF